MRWAYEIYRQGNRYGQPPEAPGRGEFGMEILIVLAYQSKAIKLMRQSPEDTRYRALTDALLSTYRTAKRVAKDKRFTVAGRQRSSHALGCQAPL